MAEISKIKAAYVGKAGHSIGNGQIYCVLKRLGWRKAATAVTVPTFDTEAYVAGSALEGRDLSALIETAAPATGDPAIEYSLESGAYADAKVWPCYDVTRQFWRHGEFDLNSGAALRLMTSETVGVMPWGAYGIIGQVYTYLYRVRLYDVEKKVYVDFSWHNTGPSAQAISGVDTYTDADGIRYPVGGSDWPPIVYYPAG